MKMRQWHHCEIMQINIDKIHKFQGNAIICTKYINGNNAQTVLTTSLLNWILQDISA